jgi:hypothetical protein
MCDKILDVVSPIVTMFQLIVTLGMFVTTFVFGMIPLKLFSTVRENTSVTSRIR